MSSCLSGGGRTYALDLEIIKSTASPTRASQTSSSPSSTLSESSNSPLTISTRKPRTPRKRPNQTYNEAAALLSTAYPNIFSSKNLAKPRKSTKSQDSFFHESTELLLPFRVFEDSGFLLQNQPIQEKPSCLIEPKVAGFCNNSWQSNSSMGEVNSHGGGGGGSMEIEFSTEFQEDFDAESILDEEIEEGIDSIMGNLCVNQDAVDESNAYSARFNHFNPWYGNPMGLGFGGNFEFGFGFGLGLRRGVRAMRHVDEGNWWNFPTVDVLQISPKTATATTKTSVRASTSNSRADKKKKKKVERPVAAVEEEAVKSPEMAGENPNQNPKPNSGLQLKLNYDEVVSAWSDRGFLLSEESPGSERPGTDIYARLAQIDLFPEAEGGGVREASVLRYKEKRRTRLFSKKIRYQVRKANADQRPRMKGRFVRRPNSCSTSEEG